eukprot:36150-Rhodomonas_salina.7
MSVNDAKFVASSLGKMTTFLGPSAVGLVTNVMTVSAASLLTMKICAVGITRLLTVIVTSDPRTTAMKLVKRTVTPVPPNTPTRSGENDTTVAGPTGSGV